MDWREVGRWWMTWGLEVIAGGVIALWKYVQGKFKSLSSTFGTMKQAEIAMLHDRLWQSCMYYIKAGKIDMAGRENIRALYKAYSELGGNGAGTDIFNRAMALPPEKEVIP